MGQDQSPNVASVDRRKATHPLAIAGIGAVSLLVFGAAGWSLGRMRAEGPAPPAADALSARIESPSLARGRLVYQVHCARCHGTDGHGDGTDAPMLKSAPRDLAASLGNRSDEVVRRAIIDGIAGTPMTGFGQIFSTREMDSLVEFVRSLAKASGRAESVSRMPVSLAATLERAGFVPEARWRLAPPLEARGAGAETASLDRLRGSLVLIIFWGTTCASCVDELPELAQLAARYGTAGLAVLPVCLDQTVAAEAHAVAAAHAKGLPVYVDPGGFARLRYDVQGLPTAVLIDRGGRILGAAQGARNWNASEVHDLIQTCLAGS